MNNHTQVKVDRLPDCDICSVKGLARPAHYDIKMPMGGWANVCEEHYDYYGTGLGLGKGQALILEQEGGEIE